MLLLLNFCKTKRDKSPNDVQHEWPWAVLSTGSQLSVHDKFLFSLYNERLVCNPVKLTIPPGASVKLHHS